MYQASSMIKGECSDISSYVLYAHWILPSNLKSLNQIKDLALN